ncbi:hypothetical protein [Priestia taiwanensis]|uniref:Uncharacterized protein n=1 Tax=Priestia taiwanensis TaxID=1347902 RepID=A0A917AYB1_9BACI|nr:hypothetical protein [Priestia taiwanensis]MBM7364579.1 hypothetical protein [Priestia taiwanensis]GGE80394.1 hypothetical protein GCM10007140_32400 [Priestia taiwanensis]
MKLKAGDVFQMERVFPIDDIYDTCMLEGWMINEELFFTANDDLIGVYELKTFLETRNLGENLLGIHVFSDKPVKVETVSKFKSLAEFLLYYVKAK